VTDKGRWSEIGEMSSDGQQWRKFFEMNLERVKAEGKASTSDTSGVEMRAMPKFRGCRCAQPPVIAAIPPGSNSNFLSAGELDAGGLEPRRLGL
jgi:hypothetical protein